MVKQVTKFIANDGTEFENEREAVAYEAKIAYDKTPAGAHAKRYKDQFNTYWYRGISHCLSDYGVWEIYGEDSNADFGGHHHTPHLATVEGTLEQAIHYAVDLKGYYTWGGGGHIKAAKKVTKL